MKKVPRKTIERFVNSNIVTFHESKLRVLEKMNLGGILRAKNPYLFKAKDITLPQDLIQNFMEAWLSSSEEKLFGDFLEELAIFIAGESCSGRKSAAQGIDLEFEDGGTHYLVSIKSGTSWGNSSQQRKQDDDFKRAVAVMKQSKRSVNAQPVLGICYGRTKTTWLRGYMKVVGQSFWHLISGNENLYTEIIEPIGHRAKEHNDNFRKQRDRLITSFTGQFINDFCVDGAIDWVKLVEFNSGNLSQ